MRERKTKQRLNKDQPDPNAANETIAPAGNGPGGRARSVLKKAFLVISAIMLSLLLAVAGFAAYVYQHPEKIKPMVEQTLSKSTDARCSIDSLSYSLDPMNIRISGINMSPRDGQKGFSVNVPELHADFDLEGAFGRKRLIVKNLVARDFSIDLREETALPGFRKKTGGTGLISRVLGQMAALLLFRDIQIQKAEIEGGRIGIQVGDTIVRTEEILGTWKPDQRLEITFGLHARSSGTDLVVNIPLVRIDMDPVLSLAAPQIKGRLVAENGHITGPAFRAGRFSVTVPFQYHHDSKKIHVDRASIDVLEGHTPYLNGPGGLPPFQMQMDAAFHQQENRLSVETFRAEMKDVFSIKGGLTGRLDPAPALNLNDLEGELRPRPILPGLPEPLTKALPDVDLAGPIKFKGRVQLLLEQEKWAIRPDVEIRLQDNAVTLQAAGLTLGGILKGRLQARGLFPAPQVTARISASNVRVTGKDLALGPGMTTITVSGRHPLYKVSTLSLNMPRASIQTGEQKIPVNDIKVKAHQGTYDGSLGSIDLPAVRLDSSLVTNLTLSLKGRKDRFTFRIQGTDTRYPGAAVALGWLPAGCLVEARDRLHIKGVWTPPAITYESRMALEELAFQTSDGACMGEKIQAALRSKGRWDRRSDRLKTDTAFHMGDGEMLVDRFYFNLKENPFNARLQGDYRFSDGRLAVSGFHIQWKDLLTVHAEGHARSKPTLSDVLFRLDLSSTPLRPIYELFVLEPFKTEKPILEKLVPTGQVSSRLTMKGDLREFTVKGHCSLEDGNLSWPEKELSLEGMDLKLPVWYRTGPAGHKQAEPLDGRLSIRTIRHAFLPEQSVDIPMKAGPNRLLFRGPITLKIPGGDLRLDSIDFRDILMPAMVVRSGITLRDVRIQPLMSRFYPRPVEGTIRGRISPILFREKEIDTKGELNVNLFEGDIVINNIGVANLFDSIPLLKLDATWRDLDLAKMTTDTAFGKVEGILKGHVENLEIAAGQPQRFQLQLETVKKAGVPQRISIKAVDNIARIGGGQSPFMGLAGTFASLFKTFPYKKIGARASLENDVFRINGLVREDNLEYIIKRGGIRGVNVVNQNPDNRIRFKDMVKRIKRITTSKGGPLVK